MRFDVRIIETTNGYIILRAGYDPGHMSELRQSIVILKDDPRLAQVIGKAVLNLYSNES